VAEQALTVQGVRLPVRHLRADGQPGSGVRQGPGGWQVTGPDGEPDSISEQLVDSPDS
jgi:hypothetical protein